MAITYYTEGGNFLPKGRKKISAWIKDTVSAEGFKTGDITYVFCSPEYHIGINREYLGHDYNTDVITFDYSDLDVAKVVSGDILIDPETVLSNAAGLDTPPAEEMMRVIIHGVLHLCGYGDKTPDEEAAMRAREDLYLDLFRRKHGDYDLL